MSRNEPTPDPKTATEASAAPPGHRPGSGSSERSDSVTVVIPSYNGAGVIRDAVTSVRAQRGLPWNLVVVDDASSDDSLGLLARLTGEDDRVTVIRNERNLGISATLNRGLRYATGAFVLILHQDCRLGSSDWLLRAVEVLRARDAVCLAGTPHHDARNMSRRERWFWITRNHIYARRTRESDPVPDALFSENKCDLFDTEFLRSVGGFDERAAGGGEDQLLAESLARRGVPVVHDPTLRFSLTLGDATTVRPNLRKEFLYGHQMREVLGLVGRRAVRRTPEGGVDRRLYNRLFGVAWILATLALVAPTLVWPLLPVWVLVLPLLARALDLEARAARAATDYDLRPGDLAAIPWVGAVGDVCYLGGLIFPPPRRIGAGPSPRPELVDDL